jgi:hypothetical protein
MAAKNRRQSSPRFALHSAVETLEARRMLSTATLLNGSGTGALSVAVDGYGAFGSLPAGRGTQFRDFTVGSSGVINRSFLYFSPLKRYLTTVDEPRVEVDGTPTPSLPDVEFISVSPVSAVSTFVLNGTDDAGAAFSYRVDLTQSLSNINGSDLRRYLTTIPDLFQSTLTQKYRFTNLLPTTSTFTVVRYLQAQTDTFSFETFGGSAATTSTSTASPDFGSAAGLADNGQTLTTIDYDPFIFFPPLFDEGLKNSAFLRMQSVGGSFVGGAVRDVGLAGRILSAGRIPDTDIGLINELFEIPALASQYDFSVGPRQAVEFTTTTTIGEGVPIEFVDLGVTIPQPGNFRFSDSLINYAFPTDGTGALQPLTINVERINGSFGPATAVVEVVSGTTPGLGYTVSPSTISFADGETVKPVTITFNPSAGIEPSSFQLALANTFTPGVDDIDLVAALGSPAVTTINVLPQAPVFNFSADSYSNVAGRLTASVTINRTGNLNGPASVSIAAAGGTAVSGTDFAPFDQRVDFGDNQTSATVSITLITQATSNPTTLNLLLSPSTPGGDEGAPSITPTPNAVVNLTGTDTIGPTVTSVSTVTGSRGIDAILLTFSEPMRAISDLSAFQIFSRGTENARGSARLTPVQISSVTYDPITNSARVFPTRDLALNRNYQISVRPSPGVTDLVGNPINQEPGRVAAFTALFSRGTRISYVDRQGNTVTFSMKNGSFDLIRTSDGQGATLTLFGVGPEFSVLTGTVRGRRGVEAFSSLSRIVNSSLADLLLPENLTVGQIA